MKNYALEGVFIKVVAKYHLHQDVGKVGDRISGKYWGTDYLIAG